MLDRDAYEFLREISGKLQEHGRRIAGGEFRGKVTAVDAGKKKVRVEIGKDPDGNPVLSPWTPYRQIAGALKLHTPPSVGQTMTVRADTGDIQQGIAEPLHWSDDNGSPSDSGEEHVLTFGDVRVALDTAGVALTVGGTTFVFSGGGFVQNGGQQTHDGKNVGATHVHKGVVPGGGMSGEPL